MRQGAPCGAVADFAARAGVPVVRFMPADWRPEDFAVAQERPAALVFNIEADAKRFHYVEEAPRIVLPLARATSKNARAYVEIQAAVELAKARLQPAAPSPAALQVSSLLTQSHSCMAAPLLHSKGIARQAGRKLLESEPA